MESVIKEGIQKWTMSVFVSAHRFLSSFSTVRTSNDVSGVLTSWGSRRDIWVSATWTPTVVNGIWVVWRVAHQMMMK
jgi:hypothetical protein